ncbi:MAG: tetratricopeptide repeat protein [Prolixibacteraceae bacterium]|jgi:tetratricopeptide (TPR) repeat protein
MKKILLVVILLSVNGFLFAQKSKVSSATSYKESGKLDKAWEAIQEAINPANPKSEKSINWPDTWEARGEILEAIYKSKDENYKKLVANPLEEAYKSFLKAIELDPKGGSPGLKIKLLSSFIPTLSNAAIEAFQAQKYEQSSDFFEKVLNLEASKLFKTDNTLDTAIMYNTGLASMNAKQFDKAIKYFKLTAQHGYNPGSSYSQIISAYQQKGDTLTSVSIMKEAFSKYPEDQSILVQLINYYITTGKTEEAIGYLDKAIAKEKDNPSFYLAKGIALDKLGRQDDAIKEYELAIKVKADYADAFYNIGVIYFNRGVKQFDVANAVPTNEQAKFEAEKKKSDEEFAKAVPYLEKAVEYNPKDTYIKDQLKNLYYRLKMMDKFEKMK